MEFKTDNDKTHNELLEEIRLLREQNARSRGDAAEDRQLPKEYIRADNRIAGMASNARDMASVICNLRECLNKWRAIGDSAMMGIGFWSSDGFITDANPALLKLLGYTREEVERNGLRWDVLTPPEYAALDQAAIEEIGRNGACTPYEKEFIHKDGHRIPVLVGGGSYTEDRSGGSFFVLEQSSVKRTEAELCRSEERYRAFISNSSEAIWRYELDEPISTSLPVEEQIELCYSRAYLAECNEKMAQMYGFEKAADLIGKRIRDLMVPSDPKNVEFLLAFARNGYRLVDAESVEVDAAGKTKYFLNTLFGVVKDGYIHRVWGIQRDVTEMKTIEAAARERESMLRALVDSNLIGVAFSELSGRIVEANEAYLNIVGFSRDDMAAGNLDWRKMTPPEYFEQDERTLKALLDDGGQLTVEKEYVRKNGRRIPVLLGSTLIAGEKPLIAGFAIDLSSRKRFELRLKTQYDVAHILAESTDIPQAFERVIESLCRHLGWEWGCVWTLNARLDYLYCLHYHADSTLKFYPESSLNKTFRRGQGIPGRVWESGQVAWIDYVKNDENFPRQPDALRDGLQSVIAFPVRVGDEIVAIIELASKERRLPDADGFAMKDAIGYQIGQFIAKQRTKDALKISEQRYRMLMEQSPLSTQIISPEGKTILVNRAWEELWNLRRDQLTNYNILEDRQLEQKGIMPYIRRAFAGEAVSIPAIPYDPNLSVPEFRRQTDLVRWVRAFMYPVRDENNVIRELVLIHEDITQKKRAEEALKVSEAKFRRLAESNIIGIMFASNDGRIIDANDAYLKLIGESRLELEAGRINWRNLTPPEYIEMDDRVVNDLAQTGLFAPYEKEYLLRDGRRIPVLIGGALLEGKPPTAVCFVLDLTERKRAEAKVTEANKELTRLSQVRSEFVSMVSHELRTPLSVIREGINLVLDGVDGPITEEQNETLSMSKSNVDRLARLIQNVLDFTKLESGKLGLLPAETDLCAIMSEISDFMRIATQKKGLLLRLEMPSEPAIIFCDADKIRQVLINLLDNAIKFTSEGGEISMDLKPARDGYDIVVSDTGIGIPPEDQVRIFEMFEQSASSKLRRVGGVGVGLAVCRKLVHMHGGKISLDSSPGKGAHFKIWLPLTLPAHAYENA